MNKSMRITPSLRFLYIFDQFGLLWGVPWQNVKILSLSRGNEGTSVPWSLCPEKMRRFLSVCPAERKSCPVGNPTLYHSK